MNEFQTIRLQKDCGLAQIVLNRPRVLNAYNITMRDELYEVLEALREDDEVGVVVLRGEGRSFCAGADLTEFGTAPSQAIARRVRWERDVWGRFLSIGKPTICAIQGYCMGSGVEMALLCDLRIASSDAIFGMPEVGLGMIPAAGGTQTIPRATRLPFAMEILLTGRRVEANEALECGLVTRVVAPEDLSLEVELLVGGLIGIDKQAVAGAKKAVWEGIDLPLAQALALELRMATDIAGNWIG